MRMQYSYLSSVLLLIEPERMAAVSVKQLSGSYSALEDRICLSLNTTERTLFHFLLTRACCRALMDQVDQLVGEQLLNEHSPRSSQIIGEFQKESLKKQLNFQEVFEGGDRTPLGQAPILVTHAKIEMGVKQGIVALTLSNSQLVRFSLNTLQLQALALLIERLAHQAQWALNDGGALVIVEPADGATGAQQLH